MNLNRLKILLLLILFSVFMPLPAFAKSDSFVSIVNPIRGGDFWDLKDQTPKTAVFGQIEILKKFNLKATWLIRFDALLDKEIIDMLKAREDEKGLFLEIGPTWAKEAGVNYQSKENWHDAEIAFLSGYEKGEREKLIDKSFERFKEEFGTTPKSVGAWWIDSYSLFYMEKKYGIISALIVADQYTTDNYQIWGQYFGAPFYPAKNNVLHPASTKEDKLPIVITQWAARDPVNGYGDGVMQSTFSVQANDYMDFHNLDTKYFSSLVDIYTNQQFNQFGQLVVGLENSYSWSKYAEEYKNQIRVLADKQKKGQFKVVTLEDFAIWYKNKFPGLSPEQIMIADDPLGSYKKTVWFMNPYFRAGWFYNQDGSVFRDIRQYVSGEEELCFQKKCSSVNFATFATRVLDEVSFGHKLVVDQGKIKDFKVEKKAEDYVISYINEAGNRRSITLLPRDIGIDGKISSIDTLILNATKDDINQKKIQSDIEKGPFRWSLVSIVVKTVEFILFLFLCCFIPGLLFTRKISEDKPILVKVFLALVVGFVILTLVFYFLSLLKLRLLIFPYLLVMLIIFIKMKLYKLSTHISIDKYNISAGILILIGTIFQIIPSFRNGLYYPFGLGFWGPNTHDGIWHLSLINQLIKSVPAQNPIFSGEIVKNYHFLYDLLVACTSFISYIPAIDLLFRFYPIFFSFLLGLGSYFLAQLVFKNKLASIFSLYLIYFAGSFGWIVAYIKDRNFAGESAFWANQSISYNLNPPFAISILIMITFMYIVFVIRKEKLSIFVAILLAGSLVGFKAYSAVLVLGSILCVGLLKRRLAYLLIFTGGSILSALIFIANFNVGSQLLIFSPFWLIHSMIDSPDRVGWTRITLAREAGLEKGNWIKFLFSEVIGLTLFVVGNLGMRVLSLLSVFKIKQIFRIDGYLFMFILLFLSFLIPILFIQSGNPWNTIQFSYYGLYLASLVSGSVITYIYQKIPKVLSLAIILFVVVLTPINSIVTASYYTNYLPHGRIDSKEAEALNFLSKQDDGVVLTYPYDKKTKDKISEPWPLFAYDSTAYVSALSGKSVFIEDEPQNEILLTDYKKRLVASKDFFYQINAKSFLKDNSIKYVYLLKIYNVILDADLLGVKNVYENEEVLIFKVY